MAHDKFLFSLFFCQFSTRQTPYLPTISSLLSAFDSLQIMNYPTKLPACLPATRETLLITLLPHTMEQVQTLLPIWNGSVLSCLSLLAAPLS